MLRSLALYLPKNVLEKKYGKLAKSAAYKAKYNIQPTQSSLIKKYKSQELVKSNWGLLPYESQSSEELDSLDSLHIRETEKLDQIGFANKSKCIIPVSGFFVWNEEEKKPFYITLKNQSHFALAGMSESWEINESKNVNSFLIFMKDSPGSINRISPNIPVILNSFEANSWLEIEGEEFEYLSEHGISEDEIIITPASKNVMDKSIDSIDLIRNNNTVITGENYSLF